MMEDKIVFVKTKQAPIITGCIECDLCSTQHCKLNCEPGYVYKQAEQKSSTDIDGENFCVCCEYPKGHGNIRAFSIGKTGRLRCSPKEPEIQTEYEWKKERFELLSNVSHMRFLPEYIELDNWLKENKPENWQTCTKENTNIGNTVIYPGCDNKYTVSYFANTGKRFLLRNENGIDNNHMSTISDYKIDINKTKR